MTSFALAPSHCLATVNADARTVSTYKTFPPKGSRRIKNHWSYNYTNICSLMPIYCTWCWKSNPKPKERKREREGGRGGREITSSYSCSYIPITLNLGFSSDNLLRMQAVVLSLRFRSYWRSRLFTPKLFFYIHFTPLILMTLSSYSGINQLLLLHRLSSKKQLSCVPCFPPCLPRKSVSITMIRLRGTSERSAVFKLRFGMQSVIKITHLLVKEVNYWAW